MSGCNCSSSFKIIVFLDSLSGEETEMTVLKVLTSSEQQD